MSTNLETLLFSLTTIFIEILNTEILSKELKWDAI